MSAPFLGEIRPFAGDFAPRDWHLCDGSLLSIAQNSALYALLGVVYGGDGITTFGLPDLRGRIPISQGQGPGLSPRSIGDQGGTESVTLTTQEIPAHTHSASATVTSATSSQPAQLVPAAPANNGVFYLPPNVGNQVEAVLAADSLTQSGGGEAHENRMPIAAISFIIALSGIYPSRN
ncbi:tail fiber protein [Sphingomonas sp. HF-S3]|uniref:Tail fiber protein n=1 Tax=Sphingomonas rustica TaxID=3103142 RepID=A0ABV0B9N8_9SPHN